MSKMFNKMIAGVAIVTIDQIKFEIKNIVCQIEIFFYYYVPSNTVCKSLNQIHYSYLGWFYYGR